ncbi:DUF2634 domain-containing protein [Acetivibrio ethanolgignens]|uniref:DUF2634 domain-containing protein n=1 Tax=Acetivibrio ethanolgignens TaxID=290052 RepID=A0A0V8QID0_9FIRM|nr:DUF2634 domain-containing protein [Acetivibrio ethanolgignens]KSV60312.1 hypothetical protein ASU35_06055 [Acetivibrio ethanolgignens]
MIPNEDDDLLEELETETQPSLTFAMNKEDNKVQGQCDGLEAMEQAIYCILNTERYQCPIYDWSYGVELADLIGMPLDYCIAEVERRIKEALEADDRVISIDNFQFDLPESGTLAVEFIVSTIFGTTKVNKEVNI